MAAPDLLLAGAVLLVCGVASWGLVGLVLRVLRRRHILDHPNPRSSHLRPTPRGGGIAVIAVIVVAWVLIAAVTPGIPAPSWWWVPLAALALAALSWIDDVRGLPALPRLLAQVVAVAVGLVAFAERGPVFQGLLPPALDLAVAGLCWLWFVNLFNFMDGIDGLAGVEAAAIGIGLYVVTTIAGAAVALGLPALAAAGAALGFLCWNWQPARVFMGDVGSVALGYLLGWLLLALAAAGQWPAALILPLYFLCDASLTLLARLARRQPPWRAHREHFYQRAVRAGRSHAAVVGAVALADGVLLALAAMAAVGRAPLALAGAAMTVAVLLFHLGRARRA